MSKKQGLTFWKLVKISRPIYWPFFVLIFYGGVVFAKGSLDLYQILIMIAMTFPMGLAGFGLNDIYDYRSDLVNPRKGGIQGYRLTKPEIKKLKKISYLVGILFYILVLLSGRLQFILTMLFFGLVSYLYIVPPFRLKGRALLDLISAALVVLLPFFVGFSYHESLVNIPWKIYPVILFTCAGQAVHTVMDMESDKKLGDKTFAIKYGAKNTMIFSFLVLLSVFLFVDFSPYLHYFLGFMTLWNFIFIFKPEPRFIRKSFIFIVILCLIFGSYYLFFYLL